MGKEGDFQSGLIKELEAMFPGSIVLKNDPTFIQGIPDLIILYKDKWAMLECKKSKKEKYQPNQEYYIDKLNKMSYSNTIYPENKKEILDELQRSFGT